MKFEVTMTIKEAESLSFAAGNSCEAPDIMESLFPNGHDRAAGYRAYEKFNDALRYAKAKKRGDY